VQNRIALSQQRFARAFSKLLNAKQGQDQSVTTFVAYITSLACKTDVSNATKRMFLCTGLCPEVHSIKPCGITYEAFDTIVDAAIWAESYLQFQAKCA
jgi:hypothetical protein